MNILDKIKEMLGDDFDKDEILVSLEAEVEEAKKDQELEKTERKNKETLDWAERVHKARAKQQDRIRVRHSLKHQKHINPARLVRLRRDGKL